MDHRARSSLAVAVITWSVTTPWAHAGTETYRLNFQGTWNPTDHPTEFPAGAHFTRLAVATHHLGVTFWETGSLASFGIKRIAELGITSDFVGEVDDAITGGTAASVVLSSSGSFGPGALVEMDVEVTDTHPLITFASMVAPSPDWFVGVSGLSLVDPGGAWIPEVTVPLYAYDAGTEEGNGFSLSNPATIPQETITPLHGPSADEDVHPFVNPASDSPVPPLAVLTLKRVPEPTTVVHLGALLLSGYRFRRTTK